jgi:rare lipoprotein A
MESDRLTIEKRLLCLLPEAGSALLLKQQVPGQMAPGWALSGAGERVEQTRLRRARRCKLRALLSLVLSCCLSMAFPAQKQTSADATQAPPTALHHTSLDRSGKARKGDASYYGHKFYKKKMADGARMDPQSNDAASKTLPLGTTARVTNLKNGSSAVVEIRDRGPYVKNRIVDVSPKIADKLGMKEGGTAPVEVKPMEVPQPDGSVKPGAGATDTQRGQ